MLKKLLCFVLILAFFSVSAILLASTVTVTYSSKARLGDGLVYTFTFTYASNFQTAWVMGQNSDGFLVTNINDRKITLEIVSDASDADCDYNIEVYGNHTADSDTSNWKQLTTTDANTMINSATNFITFPTDTFGVYPYLAFRLQMDNATDPTQGLTCRVFFDYDDKYIGKE